MTSVDALDEVLRDAARVRVTEGGVSGDVVIGQDVVLEVTDPVALRRLRDAFAVRQTLDGACMCLGDLGFEFFDGARQRIAVVGLHHGVALRWPGWNGDAELRAGDRVLQWLAEHGVGGPLARQAARQRERDEEQAQRERWLADAPAAVRDLLDLAVDAGLPPHGVGELVARRLTAAIPDPVERAAALLVWYGSGSGRCSGFPAYEALPAPALAGLPVAHLIGALRAVPADPRIDAGAVRHLCGFKSRRHQARDVAQLPAELRARLLAAARASGDDDTRGRAQRWLAPAAERRTR